MKKKGRKRKKNYKKKKKKKYTISKNRNILLFCPQNFHNVSLKICKFYY